MEFLWGIREETFLRAEDIVDTDGADDVDNLL